jgi:hypothetical protein
MRPLIVAELISKGYVEQTATARPDFLIAFASGFIKKRSFVCATFLKGDSVRPVGP